MPSKLTFALSLCRKAGALVTGFDAVKESVMKGKAVLVLCASDASDGTRRRVDGFCEELADVLHVRETQEELSQVCKKLTAVFAVTDANLAALCRRSTAATPNEEETV